MYNIKSNLCVYICVNILKEIYVYRSTIPELSDHTSYLW